MIIFTVHGEAATAGSKRAFPFKRNDGRLGVRVTDDNPRGKEWKAAVAWSARKAYGGPALAGPLRVTFEFRRLRPQGHWKRGNELSKKGRKTPYPIVKPDVLKLARAAEDALTGVLWRDDAQIVEEIIRKGWGADARLEVKVEELLSATDNLSEFPFAPRGLAA